MEKIVGSLSKEKTAAVLSYLGARPSRKRRSENIDTLSKRRKSEPAIPVATMATPTPEGTDNPLVQMLHDQFEDEDVATSLS
jgi:hypothetical protein